MTELQIEVLGLAVHAHHGVREHEKARGQRFVLDLVLVPRSSEGCESDRLEDTVSYSDAANLAVAIATEQRFDLIERLAAVVADALLGGAAARARHRAGAQARGSDPPPLRRHRRQRHPKRPVGASEGSVVCAALCPEAQDELAARDPASRTLGTWPTLRPLAG